MAIPNELTDDHIDIMRVNTLGWAIVRNAKRRRKLQKRGELIRWSPFYNGWIWQRGPAQILKGWVFPALIPRSRWAP